MFDRYCLGCKYSAFLIDAVGHISGMVHNVAHLLQSKLGLHKPWSLQFDGFGLQNLALICTVYKDYRSDVRFVNDVVWYSKL
jgi:hypothetical protein